MQCSIVLATHNKSEYLTRTLNSIFQQTVPFEFEVIVVDDGSTDDTARICASTKVKYFKLENDQYRNPSIARNVGYRAATGKIIIAQSDEVIHKTPDAIKLLCNELNEGEFLLATVWNYCMRTKKRYAQYSGNHRKRPYFFLGSLWRKDLYAIGGNDEDFVAPGYDDTWFAECLIRGQGLKPRYLDHVLAYHQDHHRLKNLDDIILPSKIVFDAKMKAKQFISSGGAWKYDG